jgi:flagellar basal body-associated protein FliL
MANEPDPVKRRLWITLVVLLALLVAVALFIAMLGGGNASPAT